MRTSLLAFAALAVSSGDRGSVSRSVTIAVTSFSSDADRVAVESVDAGSLQVDGAWLSLDGVELREAPACERSKGVRLDGPVVLDLVSSKLLGAKGHVEVGDRRFCGVDLPLRRSHGQIDGAPAELRRHSLLIRAHRGDGVRVVVRSRLRDVLWMAAIAREGFASEEESARWFLAVDLASWLGGLDLDTAAVEHEGSVEVIRIDERSNQDLLADVERSIPAGIGLYLDADGSGTLEADERTGDRRLASGAAVASENL